MLLCAAFLFNMTSCRSDNSSYIFKSAIYGNPKTLDPQSVLNDSSHSVIYNVFQGLFTYDENGNLAYGMIDDYSISDDRTVWTFKLKQGIKWSDGRGFSAECTAEDYVFAFQRLFKAASKSPNAEEYYIIKNSEAIHKEKITDLSLLGVRAVDLYTLEITLDKPCAEFDSMLTLPPAMPCNAEFYESTKGRYGLAADCVASNSYYYVQSWSYDEWSDDNNYFILKRNDMNISEAQLPVGINFFIDPTDEKKDFSEGILQVYKSVDEDETEALKNEYGFIQRENAVWGIIFNHNGSFSDLNYRRSLAEYITPAENSAHGIVPEIVSIGTDDYRSIAGDVKKDFSAPFESDVGRLASMRLIMPENSFLRAEIAEIMQKWQSEYGFYCSIEELDNKSYSQALNSGDFDIALIKLSAEYNSPFAYLNDFIKGNSDNYGGFYSRKYEHIINSALTAESLGMSAVYYAEAEQFIIDNAVFVPMCVEYERFFINDKSDSAGFAEYLIKSGKSFG